MDSHMYPPFHFFLSFFLFFNNLLVSQNSKFKHIDLHQVQLELLHNLSQTDGRTTEVKFNSRCTEWVHIKLNFNQSCTHYKHMDQKYYFKYFKRFFTFSFSFLYKQFKHTDYFSKIHRRDRTIQRHLQIFFLTPLSLMFVSPNRDVIQLTRLFSTIPSLFHFLPQSFPMSSFSSYSSKTFHLHSFLKEQPHS